LTMVDSGIPLGPGLLATWVPLPGPHTKNANARINTATIATNVRALPCLRDHCSHAVLLRFERPPAFTACFDSAWKSGVWWDWMVVCAVRYEPVSLLFGPISGSFSKKTASRPPGIPKSAAAQAFLEYHDNSISGKNRERASQSTASEQPLNWDAG